MSAVIENMVSIDFPKVLLIEDNPGDARLVELWLEESDLFDCTIENRASLAGGIQALSEAEYAVVLLDLTLPDAIQICGSLQKQSSI